MNKLLLLLLLLGTMGIRANAQDYPKCVYHYFKNKKVSTSECFDKDGRWGKARAYNSRGELIYEKELRRIAGNSSVQFTFYNSGAVRKAEWHSAPDAGIQWYMSVTDFSEDGKVTGEYHNDYELGRPSMELRHDPVRKEEPKKPQEVIACAAIYASEYWYTNTTKYTVVVEAVRVGNGSLHNSVTLKRGETLKGGQWIMAEKFEDPAQYYKFSVRPVSSKVRKKLIVIPSERKPEPEDKQIMRYYFEVRRIV